MDEKNCSICKWWTRLDKSVVAYTEWPGAEYGTCQSGLVGNDGPDLIVLDDYGRAYFRENFLCPLWEKRP
jgi:hypothetical protein